MQSKIESESLTETKAARKNQDADSASNVSKPSNRVSLRDILTYVGEVSTVYGILATAVVWTLNKLGLGESIQGRMGLVAEILSFAILVICATGSAALFALIRMWKRDLWDGPTYLHIVQGNLHRFTDNIKSLEDVNNVSLAANLFNGIVFRYALPSLYFLLGIVLSAAAMRHRAVLGVLSSVMFIACIGLHYYSAQVADVLLSDRLLRPLEERLRKHSLKWPFKTCYGWWPFMPHTESIVPKCDLRDPKTLGRWRLDRKGIQVDDDAPDVIKAVASRRHDRLVQCLADGGDPNATDFDAWTPLHWASKMKLHSMATHLLDAGANPDPVDVIGRTPLRVAVENRDKEMVSLLLAGGSDPAKRDRTGRGSAHYAAKTGWAEGLGELLRHRTQNSKEEGREGGKAMPSAIKTPLQIAIENTDSPVLSALLTEGVDVNETGRDGSTALHTASILGDEQAALELLRAGANVGVLNAEGLTALHVTAAHRYPNARHVAVAKALLRNMATPDPIAAGNNCWDGWSPLHFALFCENVAVARLLINYGADVNMPTPDGRTPLQMAIPFGIINKRMQRIVLALLLNGAEVSSLCRGAMSIRMLLLRRRIKTMYLRIRKCLRSAFDWDLTGVRENGRLASKL